MIEFIKAIFKVYPLALWISIVGVALVIFGEEHWREFGFILLSGIAGFMILIYILSKEMDDWRRK